MGNLNYIVFGGVDSRDYGIYISGEGVFNAPERDVEVVNIPGKDGDLLIDRGRFLNIQVTYPGFNFEPGLSTFAERLRAFRAALASQVGYQRLEDSFHPDEFRLASFRSGLDVKPVMYNTASTFDIVFDCKPQRFLKSGEEEIVLGEWGETETVSGSIATFEAESNTGIKSLVVDIEPIQSGTGDPSPDNVRPISGWDSVNVYNDPIYGGTVVWNQLVQNGNFVGITGWTQYYRDAMATLTANNGIGTITISDNTIADRANIYPDPLKAPIAGHKYLLSVDIKLETANTKTFSILYGGNHGFGQVQAGAWRTCSKVISATDTYVYGILYIAENGTTFSVGDKINYKNYNIFDLTAMFGSTKADEIYAMEQAQAGSGVAYFKSLFPKDYYEYNAGEETTVSAVNGDPYTKVTAQLGQTVYGGTLEVMSGKLTIEWKTVDLGILTWAYDSSYQFFYTSSLNNDIINVIDTTEHPILSDKFKISAKNVSLSDSGYADMSNYEIAYHKRSMRTAAYLYAKDTSTTDPTTFKSSVLGSILAYKMETPTEITLTPTQVNTLLGANNIWADTGEVSVEYGADPNILVNPTPFEALPIFEVVGTGSLTVGNTTVTITGDSTQDIFIDSDIMEAYEDDNGAIISRNDRINLSGTDFPKLGEETRVEANGLTSVKITPKWWTI